MGEGVTIVKFKRIYIEITNSCNLHCSFCAGTKRRSAMMSTAAFSHILKQIKPYTSYIYLHVLGEPLLHPHLAELLETAQAEGFFVNLTTNGTLLKKQLDVLRGRIRQCNISLHSFHANDGIEHDTYISDCLDCGDRLAKHGTYVSYRLWNGKNHILNPQDQASAQKLAAHYQVSLQDESKQKLASRRFLHRENTFDWPSFSLPQTSRHGTCYGLRSHCAILVDGSVVPCCLDGEGIMTLGNIFTMDFADILAQERAMRIREGFQNGQIIEPLCLHCSYRKRFDQEAL